MTNMAVWMCFQGERLRIPANRCCPECFPQSAGSCQHQGAVYGVSDTLVDEAQLNMPQAPSPRSLVDPATSCKVLSGQPVHNCFLVSAPCLPDRAPAFTSCLLFCLTCRRCHFQLEWRLLSWLCWHKGMILHLINLPHVRTNSQKA